MGVDVFFVISGFLITGLILKDLERGQFSIVEFWERRVRRIAPALALVLGAVLVAGWFLFLPQNYRELGRSALAQALLLSNVYFWRDSGYFAQSAEVKPLLHTWSLAVEEQFYLLFPFLLILLWRWGRQAVAGILILIWIGSFALSVAGTYLQPSAAFYLLPTRAWELLLGALLALLPLRPIRIGWVREGVSWAGLLAILGAVFAYDDATRFPGVAALLPCAGAALVIWTNSPQLTWTGKLLSWRPVVGIGLISYSLYLWHWPVLVFSKYWRLEPLPWHTRVFLLIASVGLAALSWKFVETPFRRRAVLGSRPGVFAFAGMSFGALFATGFAIDWKAGVPSRIRPEVRRYADASTNAAFLNEYTLSEVRSGHWAELGQGDKTKPVSIVVWGDSHAMSVMPVMDVMCEEHGVRGLGVTHSATPPLLGYESGDVESLGKDSIPYNQAVLERIRRERVPKVLLVSFWDFYLGADKTTERIRAGLHETVRALKEAGVKVWILRQVPRQRWNVPRALATTVFLGGDPEKMGLPLQDHLKSYTRQEPIFEGLAGNGVILLDPTPYFIGPSGLCLAVKDGQVLYHDSHHLSIDGALRLRPLFEPLFND